MKNAIWTANAWKWQLAEDSRWWTPHFHKSNMTDCCSLMYRRACRTQAAICFNGQSNLRLWLGLRSSPLIFFSVQKKREEKKPSAPCGTSFCFKTNGLFLYDPKLDQQKTLNLLKSLEKEMSGGFWFPSSCLQDTQPSLFRAWLRALMFSTRWRRARQDRKRRGNTEEILQVILSAN